MSDRQIMRTNTEVFIEVLAGFYRASAALDQVAWRTGGQIHEQHEAYEEMLRLDKWIERAVDSWNNSGDEPDQDFQRVEKCKGPDRSWRWEDGCTIYVREGTGYCDECEAKLLRGPS